MSHGNNPVVYLNISHPNYWPQIFGTRTQFWHILNHFSQCYALKLWLGLERYWYWVTGYWAIFADIGQYCYWWTFFRCDTQYDTDHTAVGTVHMPVNDYLVPLVTCSLTAAIICLNTILINFCLLSTIIITMIEFWGFTWYSVAYISLYINTLLCYTLVPVLVLGIGIARGQYYWILDIGCLAWYRSNPSYDRKSLRHMEKIYLFQHTSSDIWGEPKNTMSSV